MQPPHIGSLCRWTAARMPSMGIPTSKGDSMIPIVSSPLIACPFGTAIVILLAAIVAAGLE